VTVDHARMLTWARRAAAQGHAEALEAVGTAILAGIDGGGDVAEACALLTLAVERAPTADLRARAAAERKAAEAKLGEGRGADVAERLRAAREQLAGQ
jgi:TPR repeat protein